MTRSLAHRGPDGEGITITGSLGLGHRRLSIVDPTATGSQPMWTPDGRAVISYNGEFYNHAEFRPLLEARGVKFRGSCDTETLLQLLAEYGPDALKDVAGIFGLAFWDARAHKLLLARDPVGVKQVYFHDDGERIVFASEIKALLLFPGVTAEVELESVNQYLHFHTPLFDRTFFKDIHQLQPGEYMQVARSGLRKKRYWQLDGFDPGFKTPEDAVDELRHTLSTVVRQQLMSDVPVGAFFSGGIDSTAVASFAKRAGAPIQCFGVHFSGQGVVDELPFQRAAAEAIGVRLELTTSHGASFPDDMERLLYFQDQPLIGAAMIPMYHVSRLAAHHVKVCLGGQGADEVFGGYARYGLAEPARVLSRWIHGRRSMHGEGSAASSSAAVGGNLFKQLRSRNVVRLLRSAAAGTNWRRRYFDNFAQVPEASWLRLLSSDVVSRSRAWETFRSGVDASPASDPATRLLHWDQRTYLPGLFAQDDRMSMANSLESRVPLADPRLVRLAFHIPFAWKFRAGASKWILRQAVADAIPAFVLNRMKVGFDTPAETWMTGVHAPWVRDVLTGQTARSRGLFHVREVASLLDRPGQAGWFHMVWKLLCVEIWARQFLDGAAWKRITPSLLVEPRGAA